MADLIDLSFVLQGNLAVSILALFIFLGVALLFIWAEKKFKKVQFHVDEGNRRLTITRRLIRDKVVKDDLVAILMDGKNMIGPDIKLFPYTYLEGKTKVYLADKFGEELLPPQFFTGIIKERMKKEIDTDLEAGKTLHEAFARLISDDKIKTKILEEIAFGKEIAKLYVREIDDTETQIQQSNPLIASLIAWAPAFIFVVLIGVIFYLNGNSLSQMWQDTAKIVASANEFHAAAQNATHVINASTVEAGNLPKIGG